MPTGVDSSLGSSGEINRGSVRGDQAMVLSLISRGESVVSCSGSKSAALFGNLPKSVVVALVSLLAIITFPLCAKDSSVVFSESSFREALALAARRSYRSNDLAWSRCHSGAAEYALLELKDDVRLVPLTFLHDPLAKLVPGILDRPSINIGSQDRFGLVIVPGEVKVQQAGLGLSERRRILAAVETAWSRTKFADADRQSVLNWAQARVSGADLSADRLHLAAARGCLRTLDPHMDIITHAEFRAGRSGGNRLALYFLPGPFLRLPFLDDVPFDLLESTPALHAGMVLTRVGDQSTNFASGGVWVSDLQRARQLATLHPLSGQSLLVQFRLQALDPFRIQHDAKSGLVYVRLRTLRGHGNQTAGEWLRKQLETLAPRTPRGVVLDLRSNRGGEVDLAVELSSLFLKGSRPLFGQRTQTEQSLLSSAPSRTILPETPLLVLVNHATYGAAEMMASALQENKRAVIVGGRTAGAFTIQGLMPFSGGLLKLTTGEYTAASGCSLQLSGVQPDVVLFENDELYPREKDRWPVRPKASHGALCKPSLSNEQKARFARLGIKRMQPDEAKPLPILAPWFSGQMP